MTQNGIIFDIDGTLWDASESVAAAWNEVLAQQTDTAGLQIPPEQMRSLMGKTAAEIYRVLFPGLSEKRRSEIGELCSKHTNGYLQEHLGTLYPQVKETLRELSRDFRLFIVSNCQVNYLEILLDRCGLRSFFTDTECYGRTLKSKGENIQLLLDRNNLEKAVYVGDTQLDFDSAQYAGIPFLHAAYGFGSINEKVPAIQAFSELPAAVSKIFG
jgi:phosphoglycolate phosphatase